MRKTYKRLPVFFLLFAWMVLTAHQIIPHDHHLTESYSNKEEKCPASDAKTDHHKGFPAHCHAFNDLASEKVIKFVLAKYISITLLSSGSSSCAFEPYALWTEFKDISQTFPDSHFLIFTTLRAPPSLS
jgi:hypothetical protein